MIFPGDWPSPANDRPEPYGPFDPMDPRGWTSADIVQPLPRTYIAHGEHLAEVDVELWPLLTRYSWNSFFTKAGKRYFRRSSPLRRANPKPGQRAWTVKTVLLHRAVMEAAGEPEPERGLVVDHIDGNELNCRYVNLRWTTYFGNAINRAYRPAMLVAAE